MKFLFRLMVVLGLVAAACVIAVRVFLPPARLRAFLEPQVARRLHRQVTLEGVHPGWSGLSITHLRLSNEPNFAAGTFLVADDLHLRWSLSTLARSLHWGSFLPSQWDGKLYVGDATTPYYVAHHLTADWHFTDADPSMTRVNGWAHLRQGPGLVKDLDRLQKNGKTLAIALLPLGLMQSLDRLGISQAGLPNLHHWPLQGVSGDYRFDTGVMKLAPFQIASRELNMVATGDLVLATHRIEIAVTFRSPAASALGALDLKANLTGTLEHPVADLAALRKQAFKATIQNLLTNPSARKGLQDRVQKIFH